MEERGCCHPEWHNCKLWNRRKGICFSTDILCGYNPLNIKVTSILKTALNTHCLRAPNRGGLAVVPKRKLGAAFAAVQKNTYGDRSALIGKVMDSPAGKVHLKTAIWTTHIVDISAGYLLPGIY